MMRIEKEMILLEKKKEYISKIWNDLHKKFFANVDRDPDFTDDSVSNSGLTCWIIKHSLEEATIMEEDLWYILDLIAKELKNIG